MHCQHPLVGQPLAAVDLPCSRISLRSELERLAANASALLVQIEKTNARLKSADTEFEDLTQAILAQSYDMSSVQQQLGARSGEHAELAQVVPPQLATSLPPLVQPQLTPSRPCSSRLPTLVHHSLQ